MISETNKAMLAARGLRCTGMEVSTTAGKAHVIVQPLSGGQPVTGRAIKKGSCGMDDFHPLMEQAFANAMDQIDPSWRQSV